MIYIDLNHLYWHCRANRLCLYIYAYITYLYDRALIYDLLFIYNTQRTARTNSNHATIRSTLSTHRYPTNVTSFWLLDKTKTSHWINIVVLCHLLYKKSRVISLFVFVFVFYLLVFVVVGGGFLFVFCLFFSCFFVDFLFVVFILFLYIYIYYLFAQNKRY